MVYSSGARIDCSQHSSRAQSTFAGLLRVPRVGIVCGRAGKQTLYGCVWQRKLNCGSAGSLISWEGVRTKGRLECGCATTEARVNELCRRYSTLCIAQGAVI